MEVVAAAAAAEAAKRALNRAKGEGHPMSIDKEMEAVLAKLPDNMNSPEEFEKNMKVLNNVSVKKLNLFGIYGKKVIKFKEK